MTVTCRFRRIGLALAMSLACGSAARARQAAPGEKFTPARTTLDRILGRYTQELGGVAAWEKATSIVSRGQCRIEDSNLTGTAVLYQRPPNRMALTMTFPGMGDSRTVLDGARGWAAVFHQPVRPLTGAELAQYLWGANFFHQVKLRAQFLRMKLQGIENLDGHPVYVVDALPKVGKLERLYFEVDTGLLVREDVMLPNGMPTINYYADYRKVNDLVLPATWHTVTPEYTMTVRWSSIEVGAPVSESVFKRPAAAP